jgi:hypothetical protein
MTFNFTWTRNMSPNDRDSGVPNREQPTSKLHRWWRFLMAERTGQVNANRHMELPNGV